jgi:hypothetical protein
MQMAVIPFNLHGQPLEEKEFNRGDHFRILLLDKPDERGLEITLGGFSGFPSYIGRLPPAELQNTAFVINKYEDDNLFNVTAKDREILIKQITDAFNLFKATLKKYLEIKR